MQNWRNLYFVGQGMHEQYSYCRNIAYISVILWGYVLIWYSRRNCVPLEQPKTWLIFAPESEDGRLLSDQGCPERAGQEITIIISYGTNSKSYWCEKALVALFSGARKAVVRMRVIWIWRVNIVLNRKTRVNRRRNGIISIGNARCLSILSVFMKLDKEGILGREDA